MAPFDLVLREGTLESFELLTAKLQVVLRNHSKEPQEFLADGMVQPPKVKLITSDGHVLEPEDNRSLKIFDPKPYARLFQELKPGDEAVIAIVEVQKEKSGDYHLMQGQFHFRHLPAGTYRAIAEWESAHKPHGRRTAKQPLWKGRLVSNEVELSLK